VPPRAACSPRHVFPRHCIPRRRLGTGVPPLGGVWGRNPVACISARPARCKMLRSDRSRGGGPSSERAPHIVRRLCNGRGTESAAPGVVHGSPHVAFTPLGTSAALHGDGRQAPLIGHVLGLPTQAAPARDRADVPVPLAREPRFLAIAHASAHAFHRTRHAPLGAPPGHMCALSLRGFSGFISGQQPIVV